MTTFESSVPPRPRRRATLLTRLRRDLWLVFLLSCAALSPASAHADDVCEQHATCSECNADLGCGFCLATGTCVRDSLRVERCKPGQRWADSPSACVEGSDRFNSCEECRQDAFCGWLRGHGCVNASLSPAEFGLDRSAFIYGGSCEGEEKRPAAAPPSSAPAKGVKVTFARVSVDLGTSVSLRVELVGSSNESVVADRVYDVTLKPGNAQLDRTLVRVEAGQAGTAVSARPLQPGAFSVSAATTPPLGEDRDEAYACAPAKSFDRIDVSAYKRSRDVSAYKRSRAPADGTTAIPLNIAMINEDGESVRLGEPKRFPIDIADVGELRADEGQQTGDGDVFFAAGACAVRRSVVSEEAGSSLVRVGRAERGGQTNLLFFHPPLLVLLCVLAGALAGASARKVSTRSRHKTRRAAVSAWLVCLVVGALSGTVVFLAVQSRFIEPMLLPTPGNGFLLGVLGGFLGLEGIRRLAAKIFPST